MLPPFRCCLRLSNQRLSVKNAQGARSAKQAGRFFPPHAVVGYLAGWVAPFYGPPDLEKEQVVRAGVSCSKKRASRKPTIAGPIPTLVGSNCIAENLSIEKMARGLAKSFAYNSVTVQAVAKRDRLKTRPCGANYCHFAQKNCRIL